MEKMKEKDIAKAYQENFEARLDVLRSKLTYAEALIYQARQLIKLESELQ